MERDFPYTPVTTLAGVRSLTELLLEMPLPTPLPIVSYNKSLLFHPRVAKEANNLLEIREFGLIQQLVQSLAQTSVDHIILKDRCNTADIPDMNVPELLKAMLELNPDVFQGSDSSSSEETRVASNTSNTTMWNPHEMSTNTNSNNAIISNAFNISHQISNAMDDPASLGVAINNTQPIPQQNQEIKQQQQQAYLPPSFLNSAKFSPTSTNSGDCQMMVDATNQQQLASCSQTQQDLYSSYQMNNLTNANTDLNSALNKFVIDSLDMNVSQNECNNFINNTYFLIREQLNESAKVANTELSKDFSIDNFNMTKAYETIATELGEKLPDVTSNWPIEDTYSLDFAGVEKQLNARFNDTIKSSMINYNNVAQTNKSGVSPNENIANNLNNCRKMSNHKDNMPVSVGYDLLGNVQTICSANDETNRSINAIVPSTNLSDMSHALDDSAKYCGVINDPFTRWPGNNSRRNNMNQILSHQNHHEVTNNPANTDGFRRPSPAQASDAPLAHVPSSPYVGDQLPVSMSSQNQIPLAISTGSSTGSTFVPATGNMSVLNGDDTQALLNNYVTPTDSTFSIASGSLQTSKSKMEFINHQQSQAPLPTQQQPGASMAVTTPATAAVTALTTPTDVNSSEISKLNYASVQQHNNLDLTQVQTNALICNTQIETPNVSSPVYNENMETISAHSNHTNTSSSTTKSVPVVESTKPSILSNVTIFTPTVAQASSPSVDTSISNTPASVVANPVTVTQQMPSVTTPVPLPVADTSSSTPVPPVTAPVPVETTTLSVHADVPTVATSNMLPKVMISRLDSNLLNDQTYSTSKMISRFQNHSTDQNTSNPSAKLPNGICSQFGDKPKERIKANTSLNLDKNDEEITSILRGVRKRTYEQTQTKEEEEVVITVPKPKLRKLERKFVPVLEKLSVEELMETNTYVRFNRSIEKALDSIDESILLDKREREIEIDDDEVISRYQLQDLCSEAAKLKSLGAMHMIPTDRLVRLLCALEYSIRAGQHISPISDPNDSEDVGRVWMETSIDRVMAAVDASLISLYIMTSSGMPKRVYVEDVIDNVIMFIKYQLINTIFPTFDVVYRVDTKKKDTRKKRTQTNYSKERNITQIYSKIHELVSLLGELLGHQTLTDTTVLHASSMGVCPFFVDNVSELQLSCLKLVTTIFTRYENHRRLLLDDILASIARLPSSKRGLRTYRLVSGGEEHIQMLTALVLQLIQCVVALPENLAGPMNKNDKDNNNKNQINVEKKIDKDLLVNSKFEVARTIAGTFLTVFLSKCGNKAEEIDYRPLFENFVQDLLTTVNKPEWPAAELLLSLLGTMLVKNFSNKSCDAGLRVASLEYLGVIAARLRKDAVTSRCKLQTIDQLIRDIKTEEIKEMEDNKRMRAINEQEIKPKFYSDDDERTHFLQRVLLDYLAMSGQKDHAHNHARHFYIVQWCRDVLNEKKDLSNGKVTSPSKKAIISLKSDDEDDDNTTDNDSDDEPLDKIASTKHNSNKLSDMYRSLDLRKEFLINKIRPFQDSMSAAGRVQIMQTYIDYTSADLISQYLASKRSFLQSFDRYLTQILLVLRETSIAIRTKAMKCLTAIVEADPSVLARTDMQLGVNHSLLDHSTSVREAAVDLIGKFVLSRPELIDKYYDMLLYRILDTGVSVRKRVIKILKDICVECPEFHKVPEICVKMIRRVNDEEGIRKLVMEVFQNMWFTPVQERPTLDQKALLRKVVNIIDVVAASKDVGTEWFEMLLSSLFKPREDKDDSTKVNHEPPKTLITACRQIVDCLIENVLFLEESASGSAERLVACFSTLYLFAKIRPQLLVKHAITLQPYLSYKCQTREDNKIVTYVAMIMELVVPLIEHPSETFLAQLEEDTMKLIIQQERLVVASCIACLGSIVNNVTRNYKLIRDCFNKYLQNLWVYREYYEKDPCGDYVDKYKPCFRRSMFTIGLLLRHFDFVEVVNDFSYDNYEEGLPPHRKDETFQLMLFYLSLPDNDIKTYTLKAIGSACVRHHELMRYKDLSKAYIDMLLDNGTQLEIKMEVLKNIEIFLVEEDARLRKLDQEWQRVSKSENLKEMGDVSSGMASTIIQMYLDGVMQSFVSPFKMIRHASLRVVQLVLEQGLVHPIQIVPYLICMSTDEDKVVFHTADRQLQDIEKKYPGFIHMRSMTGIQLSYQLQQILQKNIIRGYRIKDPNESPTALNGFLYSILRSTKQQRRAIVTYIVRQFDDENVNVQKTRLAFLLYLADNLAYFPYQVMDEPLYLINLVDKMVSNIGVNLLHSFKECLLPKPDQELKTAAAEKPPTNENEDPITNPENERLTEPIEPIVKNDLASKKKALADDDDDDDEDELLKRIPENTADLQSYMTSAQGCILLLALRQHLKAMYGLTDSKIVQYSPTELAKVWEKSMTRRSSPVFNPQEVLDKLKEGSPTDELDESGKRQLIKEYMNFHQLMLKWDPEEEDEDKEKERAAAITQVVHVPATPVTPVQTTTTTTSPNEHVTHMNNNHTGITSSTTFPSHKIPAAFMKQPVVLLNNINVNKALGNMSRIDKPTERPEKRSEKFNDSMNVVDITMDDDDESSDDCQIINCDDPLQTRMPKLSLSNAKNMSSITNNSSSKPASKSSLRNVRPLLKKKGQATSPQVQKKRKRKLDWSTEEDSDDDDDPDYC